MLTLARSEEHRITGHFSPEFHEKLRGLFASIERDRLMGLATEAWQAGGWRRQELLAFCAVQGISFVQGGANGFFITNAEAISMLTDHFVGIDAGTAAVINIYSGSVPADADASAGAATLLAQLTCSATAADSIVDGEPGAVATFDTISDDSSADNDGTASFFRILTQSGGTVTDQGTVGTSSADLILNTTSITQGSTVSISAATITLPEGPV